MGSRNEHRSRSSVSLVHVAQKCLEHQQRPDKPAVIAKPRDMLFECSVNEFEIKPTGLA